MLKINYIMANISNCVLMVVMVNKASVVFACSFMISCFRFNMWVMPFSFFAGLVTILVFIASAIASVGFSSWCDGYVKLSPSVR